MTFHVLLVRVQNTQSPIRDPQVMLAGTGQTSVSAATKYVTILGGDDHHACLGNQLLQSYYRKFRNTSIRSYQSNHRLTYVGHPPCRAIPLKYAAGNNINLNWSTFRTRTTDCRYFFARKDPHHGLISEEHHPKIHIDVPSRDHRICTIGRGGNRQSSYEFSQ
jgi:hypothetical protein